MASGFQRTPRPPRFLSREELKSLTLRPTKFLREKFFNLRESREKPGGKALPRVEPLLDDSGQKLLPDPPKENLLQLSPKKLVFQNAVAHEVSEIVLLLINKDKFYRPVQISMESSPYFELLCPNNVIHTVPPGMSTRVRILFTPDENKDYSHELICITGKERIVVPIRGIGPRAILDLPDQLDFLECPVKCSSQKTLLVRNVGNLEAHYQLSTQSPFSVVPATGTLGAGDTMQVTVGFHPLTTGDHYGSLEVCCNTGEESIHINLHGESEDVNIGLSTNSVKVEKTFITMSNHTTMLIENRSNITAHFQWKTFPTEEDENEEKRRQCNLLQPSKKTWVKNFMKEREIEKKKGFCEDCTALLSNMVQEKIARVQEDPMLFSNDIFFIEPMEGEIRPNCSAKIKVTFKPLEALEYRSVAYCNISGRESRLPLRIRGEGQGPLVELSDDTLNFGSVFVNTSRIYEVKLINQGAIDAPFTLTASTSNMAMGCYFKIVPKEGIIAPGGIQTLQILFKATVLGKSEKKFQFSVAGSPTPVILTIKGHVIRPTLNFNISELNFGDISFGFPYTKTCRLTNTSPISVKFKLRMSDDGTQRAVTIYDQICKEGDPSWRKGIHFCVEPREFTVNPSQGTIPPQGHQDIEVTLCSNTVMEYYRKMLVDLEGFGKDVASVTILARCLVPELLVSPQILLCKDCDLKVPYEKKLLVINNTNLPGCYGLIPQKRKEDSPVFYSSPKPCGIVQPHSTAEIPVIVEVQTLGKHHTGVLIGVFGDERNPLGAELQSFGRLGEIYPSPRLIEFGKVPVLETTSRSFTLFNEGLVPTDFRLEIVNKPQCFVIEPREGVISARGQVPVTITTTLGDTGLLDDTIQLFIGNSLWTSFILKALVIGTTIVTDKPFSPEINLGYQFSFLPCIHRFKLTNGGHHFHRLFWSVECHSSPEEEGHNVSALSSPKSEEDSQSPRRTTPVFGLEPLSVDLQPGESVDMTLQGFSDIPQEVQNHVMCEAVIGTANRTVKVLETIVTCKFIDPSIEISARQLSFCVKKPSDVLTRQYQPLSLKNTCLLPLDLMLDLEQPFLVCDAEQQPLPAGQPMTVDVGETCHLYIAFDPPNELDFKSWKEKKVLKIGMVRGHPCLEHITIWGEVQFPNVQIQPSTLDFGCIQAGTEEVRSLEMTNCSSVPVKYHWSFQMDSQVNRLRHELYPPKFKPQPPKEKRTCLDCSASPRQCSNIRNVEDPATTQALKEARHLAQSLGLKVPPQEKYYAHPGLRRFRIFMDVPHTPLEAEKAFSILPLSGVLQPGERQKVSFTFFGHLNTTTHVTALCHVEGGPTYPVVVTGEASCLSYSLSLREINCGLQVFNEIHESTVTLENSSKIKFNWLLNPVTSDQHLPGMFLVDPTTGSIAPGEKQVLKFSYMPGVPGAFSRTYQLKVGDLDAENICLKGEAFFPMICVDLPWKGNEQDEQLKQLVKPLQQYNQRIESAVQETQSPKAGNPKIPNLEPCAIGFDIVSNAQVQIKIVKKAALELQNKLASHALKTTFPDKKLCHRLIKAELPEYVLDVGSVLKGFTERRTLEMTNPGQMAVSFQVNVSVLKGTGFSVDLDHMKCLPPGCSMAFEVCFESAHQPQGDVDVLLPIEVTNGPTYNIHLHATVSELSLSPSKDTLEFSGTLVGQCQVETIRLYNRYQVPCKWFLTAIKPVMKNKQRKHTTPAVPQKRQALGAEPWAFEVTPSEGTLDPGRWQDLQIRFTPKEERSYKNDLKVNVCGSSNHLILHLLGQGLKPWLKFSPPALEMGWVLVDSDGVEATVVVKNPCDFPIEFYSLDFDEQYLEEEKILRMAMGSEHQRNFLMPPRAVGGMLPPEVLEAYEAQKRMEAQQAEAKAMGKAATACCRAVTGYPKPTVQVTENPFSWAVMHHLGTGLSAERREAEQPSGIVVIVHGAPRAGKTEVAASLCNYYGAAYLSIDTVVKEAIANDQSQAGLCARELCTKAAMVLKGERSQTKKERAAGEGNNNNGMNALAQTKEEPASKDIKFTVSTAPAPQQLNISSSHGEELKCLSCVLPEDLLVDILCERLKHEDCYKGVIFDGLESLFASSLGSSLRCVLKAVKNRHHIYTVNLHQDYASWKAKEEAEIKRKEAEREKEELQRQRAFERSLERILKIDEDEYDALPEEEKARVDKVLLERRHILKERELQRLAQKLEEEAKALEEEEKQKKKKKGVSLRKRPGQLKKETKGLEKKETKGLEKKETKGLEKKETKGLEKKETKGLKKKETKGLEKKETKGLKKKETKAPKNGEREITEDPAEMEKNMILRFQIYESSQQNIAQVLSSWHRVQGTVQLPVMCKGSKSQSSHENKGQETDKPQENMEKMPEQKNGDQRSVQSSQLSTQRRVTEEAVRDEHVGVPCMDIQVTNTEAMIWDILNDGMLPTDDEMLRHLGLHPEGPPLPPAAVFSIVEYPEERLGCAEPVKLFTIVAPEGAATQDNLAKAPDAEGSSAKGKPKMGTAASRVSTPEEKQRTESPQDSSATRSRSTLRSPSTPTEFLRLKRYRWTVPAHGEVELKVHFCSEKPGKFEQTLRFELVGTKRQYEVPCSGTALYPSISQKPRVVFPQCRKTMKEDEIIFKEYVESTKQFHFGPLLCGKSRKWYKAKNCPSNSENITILNNSPMDIEVQFSFAKDAKAETFLLDPPSMTLKPKEKQELTIWAYPTSTGFLEDKLICCIEKNPDPVVFSLCCIGVHMNLDVSPLELSFGKLVLHRTDSRTLVLTNNTLLPMAWQLRGLDDLVEDFSLSQDSGTIDPRSESEVTLTLKAEHVGSIEKTLRLEVSDTEHILGIFQTVNIKISAEVYDVSLSIDMPKGPDGSLEFGTVSVLDKAKKVLRLKNKGIYNIEYRFTLKGAGPRMRDLASHFTVEPQSGMLTASQRAVNIEMLFQSTSEIVLKNKPILYCEVIDACSGKGGETVAKIPVRVSARAVYSKYSIEPASPINFGAMMKGTKETQTVMLENKGMLAFTFHIQQASALESKSSKQGESALSASSHSVRRRSNSSAKSSLNVGMFTVSPCSGSIGPGDQQKITVQCLAGQEGTCEEQLYIDIMGRDPKDNPLGIPFTLTAKSCLPALAEDPRLIFEKYPICTSSNLSRMLRSVEGTGLFIKDENRFIFTRVLVGQEAEAHFSIHNASSLPCNVVLSISPLPGKENSSINNIFKLSPVKMSLPGSSSAIATVTFTPPDKQNYDCTFQASIVIPKGPVKITPQTQTFTISGKGHEPQVTVAYPSARSKMGSAVLRFKRLTLGDSETLPLVICNNGVVPVKFTLHLEDEHRVFSLKGTESAHKHFYTEDVEEDSNENDSKPLMKPFQLLHPGQSTEFDVIFKPTLAQRLEGKIRVLVADVYSDKTLIELVGEGCMDEFTLNGLEEDTEESLKEDIIPAVRANHIEFGVCPVGKCCRKTFTITNHTHGNVMRFEWEAQAPFQFSPKVGHLLPGCVKNITVTLKSDVPVTFRRHLVKCKVTKINLELPEQRRVPDWDDRACTVTWEKTTREDLASMWPEIERVVKTVPEPAHTVVKESRQEASVYLSALVAYAQFELSTTTVEFKDTVPSRTTTATFTLENTGKIALEYSWMEDADRKVVRRRYSATLMGRFLSTAAVRYCKMLQRSRREQQERALETHRSELQQRQQQSEQQQPAEEEQQDSTVKKPCHSKEQQQQPKPQREQLKQQDRSKKLCCSKQKRVSLQRVSPSLEILPDLTHDLPLFSINPYKGVMAPGEKQTFEVMFSPKCVGKFETTMVCRIPNLEQTQKMARVILKGRAPEQKDADKTKSSAL